jgi:hypothetical protein
MKLSPQFCGGLLALALAAGAFGQGTTYTSRSVFESALNSTTTITFEDLPLTPEGIGESSISGSGVTFIGGYLFVRDRFSPSPDTGKYMQHFDGRGPVGISLPNGVTAFGADFSGGFELQPAYNATLTANLVGGSSYAYNFTGTYGFWTFFGVSFPQPIASLIYDDGASAPLFLHEELLDNVTLGVVPEPSVFGLFALGGMFLGWRLSRRARL